MVIAKVIIYFSIIIIILQAANDLIDCLENEITPKQLLTRAIVSFVAGLVSFALLFAIKSGIIL